MISNEELKKLSKLARIEISDEELGGLGKDINSILDYVGQITHLPDESRTDADWTRTYAEKNVMREDENPHEGGKFSSDLLNEAPNKENEYVKVKKIL